LAGPSTLKIQSLENAAPPREGTPMPDVPV